MSDWYNSCIERVRNIEGKVNMGKRELHILSMLKRVINRCEEFGADGCEECSLNSVLITNFLNSNDSNSFSDFAGMNRIVKQVVKHLHDKHKLNEDNQKQTEYALLGLTFGMAIGIIFNTSNGMVFGSTIILGLIFGLGIGMTIGTLKDISIKKSGKLI